MPVMCPLHLRSLANCCSAVNDAMCQKRKWASLTRSPHWRGRAASAPPEQFFTPNFLLAPRSHRRCYSIPTDPPRATLQRSIRLLDRSDEDFRARLEIALVPLHVNNNGRIGGDKDFLFSVLVFQRQRLPINRGDNPFNVRVGHCAPGTKIPWVVSFSGSAHCLE